MCIETEVESIWKLVDWNENEGGQHCTMHLRFQESKVGQFGQSIEVTIRDFW